MVSVIIPNFNHAPYLKRRIDSVLQQTYSDFEVILLDDCSTDDSRNVLLSYKDHSKVSHVIINEKNSGSPFEQWNKGFELSKGDFIWIAESDDWCEATLLENLVEPLLEDSSLVLSFCQSLLVTDTGEIIYKTENKFIKEKIFGRDFVVSRMFGDPILVNAGMAVFRKSALQKEDEQYKKMRGAGDWMFWVQIALQGNVFVSGKTLNFCLRHSGTVTAKSESSGQDMEEGNVVFRYVLENTTPSASELKKALQQRVAIYFSQRKKYISKAVKKSSLNKLLSLHPSVKSYYRQFYIKRLMKIFKNRIINLLT